MNETEARLVRAALKGMNLELELELLKAGIVYKGMTRAGDDEAKELDD